MALMYRNAFECPCALTKDPMYTFLNKKYAITYLNDIDQTQIIRRIFTRTREQKDRQTNLIHK